MYTTMSMVSWPCCHLTVIIEVFPLQQTFFLHSHDITDKIINVHLEYYETVVIVYENEYNVTQNDSMHDTRSVWATR